MKKKQLVKLIVGVSLVAVMAVAIPLMSGCAAPAPAPEPTPTPTPEPTPAQELPTYKLRLQSLGTAAEQPRYMDPWVESIRKMSSGRIDIDLFYSGELVPDDQVLPAIKAGTLDMSVYMACVNPELTPLGEIETFLPYAFLHPYELETVLKHEGLEDLIRQDYDEYGVQMVAWIHYDPALTFCSTKPLEKYEDLDGLKISSFGAYAMPLIKAGASMVNIPPEELYLAGQTGVVDALGWGGASTYYNNSWYEVYPYYLNESIGPGGGPLLINKDVWDSMPEDLQEIVYMASRDLSWRYSIWCYREESKYREYFTVTQFSPEDHEKLVAAAMEYWDEVAQKNPEIAQAIEIVRQYNDEVNQTHWMRP